MEFQVKLTLAGIYVLIGLVFSVRYCIEYTGWQDSDDGLEGSKFFTKLFGNWCERNNVEYSYVMFMYSLLLWPTYLLTMTFSFCRGLYYCLEGVGLWFFGNSYKLVRAIFVKK